MYISVDRVSKCYDTRTGPIDALNPLSFEIQENEFVSIVGPSGCGKSTLLMIISGLVPPSSGVVRIKSDIVIAPYTGLGFVFQQDVLLDWRTVLQNVMLQAEGRGGDRSRLLARAEERVR